MAKGKAGILQGSFGIAGRSRGWRSSNKRAIIEPRPTLVACFVWSTLLELTVRLL
jgi:hypothetical protein